MSIGFLKIFYFGGKMKYCSGFLRKVMGEKNIQMKEIAPAVGISEAFLSELKRGKKIPTFETWNKITPLLNLTKEEEIEAWRMWNFDRMDEEMVKYILKLEKENEDLKRLLEAVKFLKN